jgi:hypothetical protein
MRATFIKQILFSLFCLGFGWYLAAWWADISHKPLAFSSFGFVEFILPTLALVYIGIRKLAIRRLYIGLLVLCHRSLQNQPVGVESKPATLRRGFHNRFIG